MSFGRILLGVLKWGLFLACLALLIGFAFERGGVVAGFVAVILGTAFVGGAISELRKRSDG